MFFLTVCYNVHTFLLYYLPSVHMKVNAWMIKYIKVHVDTVNFSRTQSESTLLLLVYTFIIIRRKSSFRFKKMRRCMDGISCILKTKPNQIILYCRNAYGVYLPYIHTKWSNSKRMVLLWYYT